MLINQHNRKPVRVLRTATTEQFELAREGDPMALLGDILALYQDGDMEASLPQLGAVAGRIDEILPAAEIIRRTVEEFEAVLGDLARRYLDAPVLQAPDLELTESSCRPIDLVVARDEHRIGCSSCPPIFC